MREHRATSPAARALTPAPGRSPLARAREPAILLPRTETGPAARLRVEAHRKLRARRAPRRVVAARVRCRCILIRTRGEAVCDMSGGESFGHHRATASVVRGSLFGCTRYEPRMGVACFRGVRGSLFGCSRYEPRMGCRLFSRGSRLVVNTPRTSARTSHRTRLATLSCSARTCLPAHFPPNRR